MIFKICLSQTYAGLSQTGDGVVPLPPGISDLATTLDYVMMIRNLVFIIGTFHNSQVPKHKLVKMGQNNVGRQWHYSILKDLSKDTIEIRIHWTLHFWAKAKFYLNLYPRTGNSTISTAIIFYIVVVVDDDDHTSTEPKHKAAC